MVALGALCLGCLATAAWAKEPSLTAIELYDGPTGSAYLHIADVLINGKAEMRECPSPETATIDKSTYGKLAKLTLATDGVLERGTDGVLRYSSGNAQPVCVLPVNVKFEHKASYAPSELADFAVLKAVPLSPAGTAAPPEVPPLKKGVKLVFVVAPDTELAEFLLAQRTSQISGWQNYLAKYPSASHSGSAKGALALLYVAAGQASLGAYEKSSAATAPSYADLKNAKLQADLAHSLAAQLDSNTKLETGIRDKLAAITDSGRSELDSYHAALTYHAAGYAHLRNAAKFSGTVTTIDPDFPAGQTLAQDVQRDNDVFESAMQSAASAVNARQFDGAFADIRPYREFASEEPRIAAVIDADYRYHFERGNQLAAAEEWQNAIAELEKATGIQNSSEAQNSLKNAQAKFVIFKDQAAATQALEASKESEKHHDMLRAYEALSSLSPAQRALVSDDMERLKPLYVQSASLEAKNLRQAHDPIHGIADEMELENAYTYLQSAYQLTGNESFRDRMNLLGNDLSVYLLNQAKHYLGKPAGSGTELGWTYLSEALPYKAVNLDSVRDAMIAAASAHAMRSKLSVRVQFRDQTSQRDSAGLAGQLESAIIAGLEGSGVPVKVVRFGESTTVEPDFQLAGDVLQHHMSVVPTVEPQESKYLAGEHETPSDEWNKLNRTYESATIELHTAQSALQGAEAKKGAKSEVKKLNLKVTDAMKKVEETHLLLDSTPKTVTTDILRTYTYIKKTIDISGIVQLQFRIGESLTGQMADAVPVTKEAHKQYIVFENVKAEDSTGIKPTGTAPDSMEVLTSLESAALDALIAAVRKRVEELPKKIYVEASTREADGDLDGAGEFFLRFLNLTHPDESTERKHAERFLLEQFNMRSAQNVVR
jgi:hypothetical protein